MFKPPAHFMPRPPDVMGVTSFWLKDCIPRSSNGRTPHFECENDGSIPSLGE